MSRSADNLLALRILYMLTTPYEDTDAYRMGIIDSHGKKLKEPKTEDEKNSYDYLSKLVFNLKRMISKLPGGDSKLKNILAALYLIKESYNTQNEIFEEDLIKIVESKIILAEEVLQYKMFVEEGEGGGGGIAGQGQVVGSTEPTNKTGAETSTDIPVIRKKKPPIFRRQNLVPVAVNQEKGY